MIFAAALGIEREAALGQLSKCERVAGLKFVQQGRQLALGHMLKEKLHVRFVRGGNNRIGPFYMIAGNNYTKRGILAGTEFKFTARIDTYRPKVLREVFSLHDARSVKFFLARNHPMLHPDYTLPLGTGITQR